MELHEWKVNFSWIKAHVGQRGNELADRLAKEASRTENIVECYNRIPKSTVYSELKEECLKQWQNEWERTTKGATTKSFFPSIVDRLLFVVKNRELFKLNSDIHHIETRYNNDFHLPSSHLNLFQRGVYYSGVKMYNHLSLSIKDLSHDTKRFKQALKGFIQSNSFYSLE